MNFKKALSVLICISMLISVMPSLAIFAQDDETTLVAASDFQATSGSTAGMSNVLNILKAMKADGVTSADGLFFCGDYDVDTYADLPSTKEGVKFLKMATSGFVDPKDMYLVQGNHDVPSGGDSGLSPFGDNDPANGKYGVFIIHNDDYMWYNSDHTRIKRTAQKLIDYLNEKLEQGYDKPVFVLSHLPLHYSMRTIADGDAKYAAYIFDALNEAAGKGLNIVYLFGHDHSNGWDDYLGGSSVYLQRGDRILIAQKSTSAKAYKTLNFTYMNAGYVGYYNNHNGADDALTMTVFKLKNGEMTVSRYDKNGVHDLKSEGVTNAYKDEKGYEPEKAVYASPQKIVFTSVTDKTPIKDIMQINEYGARFNKVDDLSLLKDGGRYILVHNSSTDNILVPTVVTKSNSDGKRTGFEIKKTSEFGADAAFGNFKEYEWTFTKSEGGWTIGTDKGVVKLENSSDQKIKATLEKDGNVFTIKGSSGAYIFESGDYSFNYNVRGLINAFTSDPAKFYIYEYVGYSLDVKNGNAYVDGKKAQYAEAGVTVTVQAAEAPKGFDFEKWEVTKGELTLADAASKELSFKMPEGGVMLEAVYKASDAAITVSPETGEGTGTVIPTETAPLLTEDDGSEIVLVVIVIAVSALLFAVIAYVAVRKIVKKNK